MANAAEKVLKFNHGQMVKSSDRFFVEALKASVDYRGDISILLGDGNTIEGYVYNLSSDRLDYFPKNSPRASSVKVGDIDAITFSGEDTASGKSYEDWLNKKEVERAEIKAAPIEV